MDSDQLVGMVGVFAFCTQSEGRTMVEHDLAEHHSGSAVEAAAFLPKQDLGTQQTWDRAPLARFEWRLALALHGSDASLGSRRRAIGAGRLVAMCKRDEQLGVSPDGLDFREKCRVKRFTPCQRASNFPQMWAFNFP